MEWRWEKYCYCTKHSSSKENLEFRIKFWTWERFLNDFSFEIVCYRVGWWKSVISLILGWKTMLCNLSVFVQNRKQEYTRLETAKPSTLQKERERAFWQEENVEQFWIHRWNGESMFSSLECSRLVVFYLLLIIHICQISFVPDSRIKLLRTICRKMCTKCETCSFNCNFIGSGKVPQVVLHFHHCILSLKNFMKIEPNCIL